MQLLHGEKHTLARSTRGLRRTQKRLYRFLAAIPVKRSNTRNFCVTSSYVVDTELAPPRESQASPRVGRTRGSGRCLPFVRLASFGDAFRARGFGRWRLEVRPGGKLTCASD